MIIVLLLLSQAPVGAGLFSPLVALWLWAVFLLVLSLFVFENLCAACLVFSAAMRLELIPKDVCEECAVQYDIPERELATPKNAV